MNTYDFDEAVERRGTRSLKWEGMAHLDPDARDGTLPFWVADMDFPCAKPIIEALHARADMRIFGYGCPYDAAYLEAVLAWYRRRMSWNPPPEALVYSPGIVPAIGFLLDLLTAEGDGVIIQRPVYYPFSNMIRGRKRRIVNNPLVIENGRYEIDFEDLEAKAREPGSKLMILCSPHNPVGRVWSGDELRRIGRICLDNGLYLLSDEIHGDLVGSGFSHIPVESLFPGEEGRIITAVAPSKTFNLAGLQLSNLVIRDAALRKAWKEHVSDRLAIQGPNSFALAAAEAAYRGGEAWLEEALDYLDGNFGLIRDFCAARLPKARVSPREGTYLAWIDLKGYGIPEKELCSRFVREAGVLVEGGSMFGPEGEGFIRLNFACTRATLKRGLEGMAKVLG